MQIVSRVAARSAGLKRYFSGKPCPAGHIEERLVSNGTCIECLRLRKADDYQKNKPRYLARSKAWKAENKDQHRAMEKRYRDRGGERVLAGKRAWSARNRDKKNEQSRIYSAANPHVRAKAKASRKAASAQQIPRLSPLLAELNDFCMTEAATLCRARKARFGFEWHVDHLVPLRNKSASGLHVWHNIDVVPAKFNLSKNHHKITEPLEWLRN